MRLQIQKKKKLHEVPVLVLAAIAMFWCGQSARVLAQNKNNGAAPRPEITFRYIKTGPFNDGGYITDGTILWATNHTSNTFGLHLSAVEIKSGSNWMTRPVPSEPLRFRSKGQAVPAMNLKPNASGYATVQLPIQPVGTTWRVRVDVAQELTGFDDLAARVKRYPQTSGNTKLPWNPFDKGITHFGNYTNLVSQEITEE